MRKGRSLWQQYNSFLTDFPGGSHEQGQDHGSHADLGFCGVQKEIDAAAAAVDAEIFFPDLKLADLRHSFDEFGLNVRSPDLKLAIARAKALVEEAEADAVFIATCFRCAEGGYRQK